jgi:hypothetical protein
MDMLRIQKDNLDQKVIKDLFTNSLHLRNGSDVSKFKCGLRGKGNPTFNLWWALEFLPQHF